MGHDGRGGGTITDGLRGEKVIERRCTDSPFLNFAFDNKTFGFEKSCAAAAAIGAQVNLPPRCFKAGVWWGCCLSLKMLACRYWRSVQSLTHSRTYTEPLVLLRTRGGKPFFLSRAISVFLRHPSRATLNYATYSLTLSHGKVSGFWTPPHAAPNVASAMAGTARLWRGNLMRYGSDGDDEDDDHNDQDATASSRISHKPYFKWKLIMLCICRMCSCACQNKTKTKREEPGAIHRAELVIILCGHKWHSFSRYS